MLSTDLNTIRGVPCKGPLSVLYETLKLFTNSCGPINGCITIIGKEFKRDSDICMTNCSSGLLKYELFDRRDFIDEELVVMKILKSYLKSHLIQNGSYGSCFGYLLLTLLIHYKSGNYSLFKLNYLLQNIIPLWVDEFFESHKLNVDVDFHILKRICYIKWGSDKLLSLSQYEIDHMTVLSLKLLCEILPKMSKNRFGARSEFIYHHISGENISVSDSRVVNGLYFNMPFPHLIKSRKRENLKNVKVLLLKESVNIETKKMNEYSESNIGAMVRLLPQHSTPKEFISKVKDRVKEWKKLGIEMIVSQKVIDRSVQLILSNEGILCLDRISIFNFENFKKMTGCTPLSSIFSDFGTTDIGFLSSVSEVEIGCRSCIHLSNEMTDVYTVVLCSNSWIHTQEMEELMKGLQTSLKVFVSNPEILPGGGVTEFLLAQYFKERIKYDDTVLSVLDFSNELNLITKSLELLSKTITNNRELILEEYVDRMKDVNQSFLSVITNGVAKHGTLKIMTSFSEMMCSSISDGHEKSVIAYSLSHNPTHHTFSFTPSIPQRKDVIIDISVCKKNAIQSSFQCFCTLIQ